MFENRLNTSSDTTKIRHSSSNPGDRRKCKANLHPAQRNLCTPPLPFGRPLTPHRNCLPKTIPWPVGPDTRTWQFFSSGRWLFLITMSIMFCPKYEAHSRILIIFHVFMHEEKEIDKGKKEVLKLVSKRDHIGELKELYLCSSKHGPRVQTNKNPSNTQHPAAVSNEGGENGRPRTTVKKKSAQEPGRSRVKHEKTRALVITNIDYKLVGGGAKDEKTLRSVGHEEPPQKHWCEDTNNLRNSQTVGTPANNRRRKRKTQHSTDQREESIKRKHLRHKHQPP
ncbi:hypothetical protein ES288_D01G029000v1 [Gossypium darwinii]|uniref:Uncharacterized protein n=1 Tax=Gossypium darwinii TaxID=34276 RepID=A0A5D2DL78_GOSDA|nr:hypothetical protein ES288_D01G029000v1 [Gossypium darwinii]